MVSSSITIAGRESSPILITIIFPEIRLLAFVVITRHHEVLRPCTSRCRMGKLVRLLLYLWLSPLTNLFRSKELQPKISTVLRQVPTTIF